ncbi:MAG: hypothetical protein BGO26_05695 [Actinobacteria bacterium 69-20]|nr:type II toxin-antitoxin system VapC family toxin [Actinomycetota bacterium]OJV27973.1 MAG: hypothetical protein BGO26_05695 [Actinobacteria bacterium 69-20]
MIALDACVLIAHLDSSDACHAAATKLLADTGGQQLIASPITIAEVLVGPARAGQLDRGMNALRQLGVDAVDLGADAPWQLAILRAETGLRFPDCCVLLTAEAFAAEIATFDERLRVVAEGRGIAVRP